MSVFLPIGDDHLCALDEHGAIHAVTTASVGIKSPVAPDAWQVPCGAAVRVLYAGTSTDAEGAPTGSIIMPWPPYRRDGDHQRCASCWTATGKPSPARMWQLHKQGAA